jgi:uncharacterized protein (TIGR02246 family)
VTATFELSRYGWNRFVDQEIPMMSKPPKIIRFVTFAAFTSLAVFSWAAASPAHAASKDEDAVKARVAEFIALFNKGDAKAVSAFWTDDGTLVNPVGQKGTGPAGVEKVISGDLATILKDAKMEMQVTQFRPVGKDAAWVELEHTVTGAKGPDGKVMPTMTLHVPLLMVKKGKNWMIAEARPYAYLPMPSAPAKK